MRKCWFIFANYVISFDFSIVFIIHCLQWAGVSDYFWTLQLWNALTSSALVITYSILLPTEVTLLTVWHYVYIILQYTHFNKHSCYSTALLLTYSTLILTETTLCYHLCRLLISYTTIQIFWFITWYILYIINQLHYIIIRLSNIIFFHTSLINYYTLQPFFVTIN